jgi:dihydroorotate dehydrogenase (NAD+) catalytic subunit
VNVAGEKIEDYIEVIERLAPQKGIDGFELNISCPNVSKGGISFGTDAELIRDITAEARRAADGKVLMVKLTPLVTDISVMAEAAIDAGADALSLVNTFTGMVVDIESKQAVLANRTGGLSGPAIRPMAVYLVNKVYREVAQPAGIPILGLGGISSGSDAVEFMLAGASAVAAGTASFVEPDSCVSIAQGMEHYCRRQGFSKVSELTGLMERI